jgi:hypothetical protein
MQASIHKTAIKKSVIPIFQVQIILENLSGIFYGNPQVALEARSPHERIYHEYRCMPAFMAVTINNKQDNYLHLRTLSILAW